jgi:hypothetical protein
MQETAVVANELEELQRRFEEYRNLRRSRGRLPPALVEGSSGSCQAIRVESNCTSFATGLPRAEEAHGGRASAHRAKEAGTRAAGIRGTDGTDRRGHHGLPCRSGVGTRCQAITRRLPGCQAPRSMIDRLARKERLVEWFLTSNGDAAMCHASALRIEMSCWR